MATPMTIVCPGCEKVSQGTTDLIGKKIRCKGCGEVFQVTKPAAVKVASAASKAPSKPAKTADPKPAGQIAGKTAGQPEEGEGKPYVVVEMDFTPRCPHCAGEIEPGAVICLHCGYNTSTRQRHPTVKTIEHTGGDWFLWLLPGIICAIVVFSFIGAIVYMWVAFPDLAEENKSEWWSSFFGFWAQIWGSVVSAFIIWFSGMFAIKRLILHARPPEKVKY
jgi:hypothetical protein